MEKLNVCYTVNQTYLNPMLVSIYSLLENNQNLEIFIYIIFEECSIEQKNMIDKVISHFSNGHLYIYDTALLYSKIEQYNIPTWRGTSVANARLFLSSIIPNCPDNLLYLDGDTIIVGNLNLLIEREQTKPIAAVLDHMSKTYWKNLCPTLSNYFNSGVLQIDYNLWNKNNGNNCIIKTIEKDYPLSYPDQDILNIAFQTKIDTLPLSYNLFPFDLYFDVNTLKRFYSNSQIEFYDKEDILLALKNPKIFHAVDFFGVRTWQNNRIHPFQSIYLQYLIKIFGESFGLEECNIAFANIDPRLFKLINYLKVYTPREIRHVLKRILVKKNKL